MSAGSSPDRQRLSKSKRQCDCLLASIATRGRWSVKRNCTFIENFSETDAKALRISRRSSENPSSSNSTLWKKTRSTSSVCCSACTIFPPCAAMNSATAATTPRWSGQESKRTPVADTSTSLPAEQVNCDSVTIQVLKELGLRDEGVAGHRGGGCHIEGIDARCHRDFHHMAH